MADGAVLEGTIAEDAVAADAVALDRPAVAADDQLAEIRARAARHQAELDAQRMYLRIGDLAARWSCSPSTVRTIPYDDLPFLELGRGAKHKTRRFHPDAVAAYEALLAERARVRRAS